MFKLVFFLVVPISFLISCNETINQRDDTNEVIDDEEMLKTEQTDVISPELTEVLRNHFPSDNIDKNNSVVPNVYIVKFYTKESDCYVNICSSLCYESYNLKGYTLLDDNMISFYNIKNECMNGLIDPNRLEKDAPEKFPDENSDYAKYIIFDGLCKEYKIEYQGDDIELVFSKRL